MSKRSSASTQFARRARRNGGNETRWVRYSLRTPVLIRTGPTQCSSPLRSSTLTVVPPLRLFSVGRPCRAAFRRESTIATPRSSAEPRPKSLVLLSGFCALTLTPRRNSPTIPPAIQRFSKQFPSNKPRAMAKQPKHAISPTRQEDYPEWYQQVVRAADLAEVSPVRGCMVIKPWGYALWENIQKHLDRM